MNLENTYQAGGLLLKKKINVPIDFFDASRLRYSYQGKKYVLSLVTHLIYFLEDFGDGILAYDLDGNLVGGGGYGTEEMFSEDMTAIANGELDYIFIHPEQKKYLNEFKTSDEEYKIGGFVRVTSMENAIELFLTTTTNFAYNKVSVNWTDENGYLFQYGTLIAKRVGTNVYVTTKFFSKTTSTLQNTIRRIANSKGFRVIDTEFMEKGGYFGKSPKELKVNGLTRKKYIDSFYQMMDDYPTSNEAELLDILQNTNSVKELVGYYLLKDENEGNENIFDYPKYLDYKHGDIVDLEENEQKVLSILSSFYVGYDISFEIEFFSEGDVSIDYFQELDKIKEYRKYINFNKVVGFIDYDGSVFLTTTGDKLFFYQDDNLIFKLEGLWNEKLQTVITTITKDGQTTTFDSHVGSGLSGIYEKKIGENFQQALESLGYTAVVDIEGYAEYVEDADTLQDAETKIKNIKENTSFSVVRGQVLSGKLVPSDKVIRKYNKGGSINGHWTNPSHLSQEDWQDLEFVEYLHAVGDYKSAFNYANNLETIVRDEIPLNIWKEIGGKLTPKGEENLRNKQNDLSDAIKKFSKSAEIKVRENISNGMICIDKLKRIIGKTPDYPYQIVGSIKLTKCFLSPYYKIE